MLKLCIEVSVLLRSLLVYAWCAVKKTFEGILEWEEFEGSDILRMSEPV